MTTKPDTVDAERVLEPNAEDIAFGARAGQQLRVAVEALRAVDQDLGHAASLTLGLNLDGSAAMPEIPPRLLERLSGHGRLAVFGRLAAAVQTLTGLCALLPAEGPRLAIVLRPPRFTITGVDVRAVATRAAAFTDVDRHKIRILGGMAERAVEEAPLRFSRLHAVIRRGRLYQGPAPGPTWGAVIATRWEDGGSYSFQRHQLTLPAPDAATAVALSLTCGAEERFIGGGAPIGCPLRVSVESVSPAS